MYCKYFSPDILLIIIFVIIELLTVTILKQWSQNRNKKAYLFLGLFGYFILGCLFAYILYLDNNLTIHNALWQILNIILISILGIFIYKEKLNKIQIFGLFLAIITVIIFSFS